MNYLSHYTSSARHHFVLTSEDKTENPLEILILPLESKYFSSVFRTIIHGLSESHTLMQRKSKRKELKEVSYPS